MMLLKEGNLRTRWTPFVLIAAAAVRLCRAPQLRSPRSRLCGRGAAAAVMGIVRVRPIT